MKFKIDLKIFAFIIIFYITKQIGNYGLIMIFAFIHELGHLLAGLLLGMKPEKISIIPVGVSIKFKIKPEDYNKKIKKGNLMEIKKIIVASAGPLTNLIIILIMRKLRINNTSMMISIYANIVILMFNLIPIYPLDGARILQGILHIKSGKKQAEKIIYVISYTTTVITTIISSVAILYINNISILFINAYLWYLMFKENKLYKKRRFIYEKILENQLD